MIFYLALDSKTKGGSMGSVETITFEYETIRGFFQQDEPDTNVKTFDYVRYCSIFFELETTN
jgi:hypothetical protein